MATIANLMVKIGGDISGLLGTFDQAEGRLKKMSNSFSSVGKGLTLGVSVPLAGIGAFALNAGMEFEQGMSNIKAVSGATADEMTKLHDLAIRMGKDTAFSARGAADGIEELIKAGLSVEQIMNGGLQGALDLAQAGNIDLASAAEVASTALNAFKDDALSVTKAANILAGAANASATDVMEMKMGLSQASAVAAGVGMSFLDTSSALAVFAQNGLKGSDAGTSLKTMLLNLQPQTKSQTALFNKLGLMTDKGTSAFFDQSGKLKNLTDIADTLRRSVSGMTDAQRLSTLETLFGTDAIRAANILYREGADGIQTMQANMADVTAQEVATEKMNNVRGSLEQLKGSLETAAISIYELNQGPLKDMIDNLTQLVNGFTGLSPEMQQFILIAAGVAAAIGPVLWFIGGMASGISALITLFAPLVAWIGTVVSALGLWIGGAGTFGEAMLLISGPIGWIIAAVIALGVAFVVLWNQSETFKNGVIAIWNAIYTWAITNWPLIRDTIIAVFSAIWAYIQPVVMAIWSFLVEIFGGFFVWWTENWGLIRDFITTVFGAIWAIISHTVAQILEFLGPILNNIWNLFKLVWTGVEFIVKNVWAVIKLIIKSTLDIILGIIKAFMQIVTGDWAGAWNTLKETASKVLNNIFAFIKEIFGNIMSFIASFTSRFFDLGRDLLAGFKDGIVDAGHRAIQAAMEVARKVKDAVAGFFKIHSPSRVMMEMGGFITDGFAKGILDNASYATKAANQMSTSTMGGASSGIPSVSAQQAPVTSDAGRPIIIYLGNELIYEGMDNHLGNSLVKLGGT